MRPKRHMLAYGLPAGLVLLISFSTAVLAQGDRGYDISWFALGGGGGESTGGNYSLSMTLGQPDVGMSTGGAYESVGGFWGGVSAPPTLYLPLWANNYCAPLLAESEPNNSFAQANVMCLNNALSGTHDLYDVFQVRLSAGQSVQVNLANTNQAGVQMQLYYQSSHSLLTARLSPPYTIQHTAASTGPYYIYLYTDPSFGNTSSYTLQVTSP